MAYVRKHSLGQLLEFTAGQCTGAGTGGPRARKDTTVGSGRCKQERRGTGRELGPAFTNWLQALLTERAAIRVPSQGVAVFSLCRFGSVKHRLVLDSFLLACARALSQIRRLPISYVFL